MLSDLFALKLQSIMYKFFFFFCNETLWGQCLFLSLNTLMKIPESLPLALSQGHKVMLKIAVNSMADSF